MLLHQYQSNLERVDTSGQGTIGSAMTVSSGVFTFPATGIYKIEFISQFTINGNTRHYINYIESSRNNGSSWTQISDNVSYDATNRFYFYTSITLYL